MGPALDEINELEEAVGVALEIPDAALAVEALKKFELYRLEADARQKIRDLRVVARGQLFHAEIIMENPGRQKMRTGSCSLLDTIRRVSSVSGIEKHAYSFADGIGRTGVEAGGAG
jgi:hypothetical protein